MKKTVIPKAQILDAINNKKQKKELAADLNVSVEIISSNCKDYKIDYPRFYNRPRKHIWKNPEIDSEWLIKNWVNTSKSLHTLAMEFNVSESILEHRVSLFGITKKYKYYINREKLFNIADINTNYLAGLIATDGYLELNHDAIAITLVGEDENKLLTQINEYFESTSKICVYDRKNILRISTDGIKDFLNKTFNIPYRNKTFYLDVPKTFYNEDCAKAYIRGVIDGDGYIAKNGQRLTIFTASEKFIQGLIDIIKEYTCIDIPISYKKTRGVQYPGFYITYRKCRQILDWVYSLEDCFKLERKYKNYLKSKI